MGRAEGAHPAHYPLSGWKVFDLVITSQNDAREPAAGISIGKPEALKWFAHVQPKARQIIDIGSDWKYWVRRDRIRCRTGSTGAWCCSVTPRIR